LARLEAFIRSCKRTAWYRDRELPCLYDIFDDTDDNYFNNVLKIGIKYYTHSQKTAFNPDTT